MLGKNYHIVDYIEIILIPCRHNTFWWNEECDLLSIEKPTLKFNTQLWLLIRSSTIEDPYVFLRLSVGPPIKLCIFFGTLFNSCIEPLDSSSYIARLYSATTPKQVNKGTIMRTKTVFTDGFPNGFRMKDHPYIGWKIALLNSLWDLFSKSLTNSTQSRKT